MNRLAKQLIYGSFYLAIIVALAWGAYRSAVPAPTCTDNVQNQREEGVDCGAVCGKSCPVALEPLGMPNLQILTYENGTMDLLVRLDNPNAVYGASRVPYSLKVTDSSGKQVFSRQGSTFVNALESHYLVFPLVGVTGSGLNADLQIDPAGVQWAALADQTGSAVGFSVRQDQLIPSLTAFRYNATVVNGSKFDFNQVQVVVLLYDAQGELVGVGSTVLNTLKAGEQRGINVDWPFPISAAVRAQSFVTTNVFDNDNYIRTYGSQERFQGF